MPPIDSPAMARFSRPGSTRYVFSIMGIRSVSIISVNVAPVKLARPRAGQAGARAAPGRVGAAALKSSGR